MKRDIKKEFPIACNYKNIRDELQTGDVVIFGGHYLLSKIIRFATRFPASHVATIIRDGDRIRFVEASEGDMYPEREGVIISYFSNSIPFYKGDIWIARLSDEVRKKIDSQKLYDFLLDQIGKGYDYSNMKFAGLDKLDKYFITYNKENWSNLFCSELVAAGLKYANIIQDQVNTSEMTPADIIKLNIFQSEYYQIKAFKYKAVKLPGFNTISYRN